MQLPDIRPSEFTYDESITLGCRTELLRQSGSHFTVPEFLRLRAMFYWHQRGVEQFSEQYTNPKVGTL